VIEENSSKSHLRNCKNYKQIDKASEILFSDSLKSQLIPAWLRLNAEDAHPSVQFALGFMYDKNWFVEDNYEEACFWYKMAAKEGDIDAQFFLGQLHDTGQKHQNEKIALKWFNEAAKQGDKDAQKYIISYAKNGSAEAYFCLGEMYHAVQDHLNAIKCFAGAASEGDKRARDYLFGYVSSGYKEAYFRVGQMYAAKGKEAKAIQWFFTAAKKGSKRARSALCLYARRGDVEAQFNLGWLYVNGFVGEADHKQGRKWFIKAARQNHSEAQLALRILDALTGQSL
jgi:hypothetical protein